MLKILFATDGSERADGFRKRILLSRETRDETATPDLAASLHAPIRAQAVAERRQRSLRGDDRPEDDGPAAKQAAGAGP